MIAIEIQADEEHEGTENETGGGCAVPFGALRVIQPVESRHVMTRGILKESSWKRTLKPQPNHFKVQSESSTLDSIAVGIPGWVSILPPESGTYIQCIDFLVRASRAHPHGIRV